MLVFSFQFSFERKKKLELPLKQGVSCRAVQSNISNKRIKVKNSTAAFLGTEPCQAGARSWVPLPPQADANGHRRRKAQSLNAGI